LIPSSFFTGAIASEISPAVDNRGLRQVLPQKKDARLLTQKDLLKNGVIYEDANNYEEFGGSLIIEGDFNNDGILDVATCGVFFDEIKMKEIPFLIILSPIGKEYRIVFYMEFECFFYLFPGNHFADKRELFRLCFRFQTDSMGVILGEGSKYTFQYYSPPPMPECFSTWKGPLDGPIPQ
jgi:hypothetical protein